MGRKRLYFVAIQSDLYDKTTLFLGIGVFDMKQTQKFETLIKHSKAATGAAVFTIASVSPAFAALVGEDTLVITDINVTLSGGVGQAFDLDGDGFDDFGFKANDLFGQAISFRKSNGIFTDGDYATTFDEGDYVGGLNPIHSASLSPMSKLRSSAYLYKGGNLGPLGDDGSSAYIGVVIERFGIRFDEDVVRLSDEVAAIEVIDDGPSFNFGWFEVERGSLTVLRSGYQTVSSLAAPIPVSAVPLPATLPLLLGGAVGLAAFRRRKAAA